MVAASAARVDGSGVRARLQPLVSDVQSEIPMAKRFPALFVLTSMAVLSATVCLTGCESSRLGSAGDPQQQCRDLLESWCSESVDCFVANRAIAPADAASVLNNCQENGALAFRNGELYEITTPDFVKQPSGYSYDGTPTDCSAAVGVSANYEACLSGLRGSVCTEYGLEPTTFFDCGEVIQVSE
jgi:hypothetical protein